jgi:hypothetical protein
VGNLPRLQPLVAFTAILLVASLLPGPMSSSAATTPIAPQGRSVPAPLASPHFAATPDRPIAAVSDAASGALYTQEGATVASVDGNNAFGFNAFYVELTATPSPYPTGYELNGLSNSGDWYQVVLEDNWPGCFGGFNYGFEVWNATGTSVEQVCYPSVGNDAVTAGDYVDMGMNISGDQVCMSWEDLFAGTRAGQCVAEPDSGGTYFQSLEQPSSGGYFTGPMTEVVEPGATRCGAYTSIPRETYQFVQGAFVSSYLAWSDEFEAGAPSNCYFDSTAPTNEGAGNYTETYFEASGGSQFGPHWEAAKNTSAPPSAFWWTFSTDDSPVTVSSNRSTADVGQPIVLTGSSAIGTSPLSFEFLVDGQVVSTGPNSVLWSPNGTGTFFLRAVALTGTGSVIANSANLSILVSPDPRINLIRPSVNSGEVDSGASVLFTANVSGGLLPAVETWSGLPAGCLFLGFVASCSGLPAGQYVLSVTARDSNGYLAASQPFLFVVNTLPSVRLVGVGPTAFVGSNVTFYAIGAGGSAPLVFAWSTTLIDCQNSTTANISVETCTPRVAGETSVSVVVTDGASGSSAASLNVTAVARPPGSNDLSSDLLFALIGAGVAALLIALALVVSRRRSSEAPATRGPPGHAGAGFAPTGADAAGETVAGSGAEQVGPYWEVPDPIDTTCRRCGNVNPPGSHYCGRCAIPLEGRAAPPQASPDLS